MALDPVTAILDIGGKVFDKIFPDPLERDKAKLRLLELQQTGELAALAAETDLAKGQLEINKQEAAHASVFVAGWRPAIGWTCAGAYAYHFVIQPFLSFIIANTGHTVILPEFDMGELTTVLLGLLGLGGLRTFEKYKGVTKGGFDK